ncbi:MAG: cell wall-binding repeat-containing protein [Coriobacteriia bacterium]|nr:cell wall-binding repeat-containing protein [Coriobacteriia bacterium]
MPYFARNGGQEAILSGMAINPAAIRVGNVTYLAYQGPGFDPYVASYESATGVWRGPTRVGTNPLKLDAHGAPALYLDPSGRLHAFYGSHNTAMQHSRQSSAGPAASWEPLPALPAGTYPQVASLSGDRMLLFYRNESKHWVFRTTSDSATTFGNEQRILTADSRTLWYADFHADAAGAIHAMFMWYDQDLVSEGGFFVRRNIYYAVRLANGTWQGVDGSTLSLPLTLAEADAHCMLVDSGDEFVNEVTISIDSQGAPCATYLIGSGSGPGAYEWRFIRRDAGGWRTSGICTTDHYFDAAALDPRPDGTLEAFVVAGGSDARGSIDGDYRGRGGLIEKWTSSDNGHTWGYVSTISPNEPGVIYSDPVLVRNPASEARVMFTDWTDDESNFFHRMFLWGDSGLVQRETPLSTDRIAGSDRVRTAIDVSKKAFPESARYVIIATSLDFPDALVGAPLAATVNGPVLLTPTSYLTDAVATEIKRLGAKNAIVLGGPSALSANVVAQLKSKAGVTTVSRVGGQDRYETALLISRRMRDRTRIITKAMVVSGKNWPDAIAAAPLAAANDWPIVLVAGTWIPDDSSRVLAEYGITSTIIVGQSDVVSSGVEDKLPSPTRIGGNDRFETSALLAEYSLSHGLLPGRMIVTTGLNFPDALAAGALGGRSRAPILLVRTSDPTPFVFAYATKHGDELVDLWAIGETDVVSDGVLAAIRQATASP